jgi:hypothetical protein
MAHLRSNKHRTKSASHAVKRYATGGALATAAAKVGKSECAIMAQSGIPLDRDGAPVHSGR